MNCYPTAELVKIRQAELIAGAAGARLTRASRRARIGGRRNGRLYRGIPRAPRRARTPSPPGHRSPVITAHRLEQDT